MNKTYFLPFLLVAAVSAAATADTYTNFLTGVSSVASDGTPTAVGGTWTVGASSLSKVAGKDAFEFETQDAQPMTLTVTAAPADTNTIVKLEMDVSVADVGDLMATLPEGAQTAFAVSTNAYNAWNGSAWVALDEVPDGIDDSQTTNLVVEIKYQGDVSAHKRVVRFSIGGTALQVRTNGSEWVELATTANNLTGLSVSGSGTFAKADASVMLGIAEYDGVKYGTLAAAVTAASTDLTKTIEVLRETAESVTLPDGAKIADNGNVKGVVTVPADASVEVQPEVAEFTPETPGVATGTSGAYTIPVNVSGGTVNVKLPDSMSNKEVVGTPEHTGSTVSFTIQTASSVLAGANPTGLTAAPTNNIANLRDYLAAHTNAAYIAADASSETIKSALEATRENGLKLYQSYALGIPPTTPVKPVTVASDSDASNITLSIPGLAEATPSGDYTITYKVGDTVQAVGASSIKIPLATGNTRVKIVLSDK